MENVWVHKMLGDTGELAINELIISTRDFNRYLNYLEDSLPGRHSKVNYYVPLSDEEASGISITRRNYIDKVFSGVYIEDFRELFYKSMVMAIYSRMEKELLEFCQKSLELEISVSLSDIKNIKGGGIDLARKFLDIALGYDFNNNLWKELINAKKVRNYLVHQDDVYNAYSEKEKGKPKITVNINRDGRKQDFYLPLDKNYYQYLKTHKLLNFLGSATKDGENLGDELGWFNIKISYEYCKYLIDFRKRFLLLFFNDLKDLAKEHLGKE